MPTCWPTSARWRRRSAAGPDDVFVSWLPLYHDMGLIGAWLGSFYVGMPLVVMSPLAFLARPQRWLETISRWRGTLSAGPNFAYELCLNAHRRRRTGRARPVELAARLQRCRGGQPRHRAALPAALRRLRPEARSDERRSTAWPRRRSGCCFRRSRAGRASTVSRASTSCASTTRCPRRPTMRARCVSSPVADRCPGTRCASSDADGEPLGERIEGRLRVPRPVCHARLLARPEQTARLFRLRAGSTPVTAPSLAEGDVFVTGRRQGHRDPRRAQPVPAGNRGCGGRGLRRAQGLRGGVRPPR